MSSDAIMSSDPTDFMDLASSVSVTEALFWEDCNAFPQGNPSPKEGGGGILRKGIKFPKNTPPENWRTSAPQGGAEVEGLGAESVTALSGRRQTPNGLSTSQAYASWAFPVNPKEKAPKTGACLGELPVSLQPEKGGLVAKRRRKRDILTFLIMHFSCPAQFSDVV